MKDYLEKNMTKILSLFLVLQPIIDCFTAFSMNVLHQDITFGIILRVFFLGMLILYNLITTPKNKKNLFIIFLTTIYIILFSLNIYLTKDSACLFYELKNLARYSYFPLLLWNLYQLKKTHSIEISKKTIFITYGIYLAFLIIPMITNTDFSGYYEGKVGSIGWFHSSNEIGAIFSLLLPLIVFGQPLKQLLLYLIPIAIVFFSLGSKITILSLLIVLFIYALIQFKNQSTKRKKQILSMIIPATLVILIALSFLLPKTAFYKNIQIHLDFLEVDSVTDILTDKKLVDHFIFSSRLTFLKNTSTSYKEAPIPTKILGLGFIENYGTDKVNLKTIEMDPMDIFFRLGIFGCFLFVTLLLFTKEELKKKKNSESILAIALSLFIASFAGHVFTSPAVSIYPCIILLNMIKEEKRI